MAMSPRLLRPTPSGFDPRRIGNLAAWFDASVSSSITLNGSTVSEWRDLSGNGRHAVQATAAGQPTYVNSGLSGKSVIEASAPGKSMKTAAFPAGLPQTVFVVAKATANNGGIFQRGAINTVHSLLRTTDAFQARRGQFATSTVLSANSDYNIFTCEFQSNLTRLSVNTLPANDSTTLATGDAAATDDRTLALFNLDSTFSLIGGIAEVLYYNAALSVSQRRIVETYLSRKWGIAIVPPTASNADAQAWINNVYANGGTVSTATANAVNTFCTSIESAGIRDRFYRLNLFAGTGLSAALVPLYRGTSLGGTQTGNVTDTNVGPFVSGDYSETVGLTSNSDTKHLRTGLNLNAMDAFTTGHFMSAIGAYPGAVQYPIGAVDGSDRYVLQLRTDRAFWGSTTPTSPASNNLISANGMALMTRESATALTLYNGSTSVGTVTSSITPAGGSAEVYVYRTDESVGSFPAYVGNMRAYSIGRAMTSAQVASLYTAMQSLQTSLGRTQA
jgi:hypothetical protein